MEKKNSDINGKNLEMVHREEKRDLNIKKKRILWELSDSIRKSNIKIIDISQEEREKGTESLS